MIAEDGLVHHVFGRPLTNLGSMNGSADGIWTPGYEGDEIARFMSDYYAHAEAAQSLGEASYLDQAIPDAMARIGVDVDADGLVLLEVGAGTGSGTFPLLRLFQHAQLIVTELSLPMLGVLKSRLEQRPDLRERCCLLQLNAEHLDFKRNSIDLLVGAAVLHHLFHPERVLRQAANFLRPGGSGVFFEPFESGYGVLYLAYRRILKESTRASTPLTEHQRLYFEHSCWNWKSMRGLDKTAAFFQGADDKWLFTRAYLHDLARQSGLELVAVTPLVAERPFEELARSHFQGNGIESLPPWVWSIIADHEDAFSGEGKRDVMTEGCVWFRKPA